MLVKLDEITRKELVAKTKVQSPTRYNKRMDYRVNHIIDVDFDQLLSTDRLVIDTSVGDYVTTVAFDGFLSCLSYIVSRQAKHNCTLQSVTRAIMMAIESEDVYTNCTCGDFRYRYAYWATKYGYKYGEPETRPPKVRNANDDIGAVCKHLTMVLANKRWTAKAAQIINADIRKHCDDYREAMDLSEDEFYINEIVLFGDLDKKNKEKEPELEPKDTQSMEPKDTRRELPRYLGRDVDDDQELEPA